MVKEKNVRKPVFQNQKLADALSGRGFGSHKEQIFVWPQQIVILDLAVCVCDFIHDI